MINTDKKFIEMQARIGHYIAIIETQSNEIDKLRRFKEYVHKRLDDAGVTVDPESPHKQAGCRIGGRLDEVFQTMQKYKIEVIRLNEILSDY